MTVELVILGIGLGMIIGTVAFVITVYCDIRRGRL
jgi:hypothetical protein